MLRRLDAVETDTGEQFGRIEANERALATAEEHRRALSAEVDQMAKQLETRRQRLWAFGTILLTSLLLPLLVVFLTVWIHLRSAH
jgi:hypothetical protein